MSPFPTPLLPCLSLLPSGSSSPGVDLCCFPVPCPQKTSPAPPSPAASPQPSPIPLPPALARWSLWDGGDPNPTAVPPPGSAHPQLPTPLLLAVPDRGPQTASPGTSPSATAGGTRWRGDPKPSLDPAAAVGPAHLGGTPGAGCHHLGVTRVTSQPRARLCPRGVPASEGCHRGEEPEREVPPSGRSPPQVTEGPWTS